MKRKQAKRYVRVRGIPVQIMFSEREHAGLMKLARARDRNVSELVRAWLRRAIASASPKRAAVRRDPRQLDLC